MQIEDLAFNTGKRISIELGTQLKIRIDGVDMSFTSNLIGMDPHKYLVIDAPISMLNYARHKLFQGSKIIVGYLYKGSAFGFRSELIEDIYTPLKLLFVEYPEIIEEQNLRGQRIDCVLPIKIKINDEESRGVIVDINEEGCRYLAKKAEQDKELSSVHIDEQVTLKCNFPQTEGEYEISGKIKYIRMDEKQMILGVIYDEIEPEIKDIISQYMRSITE